MPAEEAVREARRPVTVLFCDLSGSTELGERLDAEPLRDVMQRYYDEMRLPIERHGGRIEKFIGDAVVAVFGVPATHEDDALRAVRASWEMREALGRLNKELERDHGVTLHIRQGINSGEVLDRGGHVLGDPVNVAARLEQAAGPGEILLAESTRRLVRDAVVVEAIEPLTLKGKSAPEVAWRLGDLIQGAEPIARRLDSPMVGRDRELRLLRDAFDRAVLERSCHLFTVLGSAGVGKSRLARELERTAAGASVFRGRCLPYGQGITYWPLREIIAQACRLNAAHTADEATTRIAALIGDDQEARIVGRNVAAIAGVSGASLPGEEIAWSVRRFFESLARNRPAVVVFEDIHWAEPAMLDVIDHVAELARDAPLLLVCPARPELLEARPAWGGGKPNATSISLEPLSAEDSEQLVYNLLGEIPMPEALSRRIADAAGGTPLFVEEMIGMLIDDGLLRRAEGRWVAEEGISSIAVPATIQSLLAARLDRLPAAERDALARAAVIGREHWRAAVAHLLPAADREQTGAMLTALVRKDLIRPERSSLAGQDAYRFRHALILDAAYRGLPKKDRAELHERFADWLERNAPDRDEILGYHLEQAYRYRAEVGPGGEDAGALARRAATVLARAGRRALSRVDGGAINLLSRAVDLLGPDSAERAGMQVERARALSEAGAFEDAIQALTEARDTAERRGDRSLALEAELQMIDVQVMIRPQDFSPERARATALAALDELEGSDSHRSLSLAYMVLGDAEHIVGHCRPAADAYRSAVEHATRAGDEGHAVALLSRLAWIDGFGPLPIPECLATLETYRARLHQSRRGEVVYARAHALLDALSGRFEDARRHLGRAAEVSKDLGEVITASMAFVEGPVELLAGDWERAERTVRAACDRLERLGERSFYSTLITLLAEAVYRRGRIDEAMELSLAGEKAGSPEDLATRIGWSSVRAKALAAKGRIEEGERMAREGLAVAMTSDVVFWRWQMFTALTEVLRLAGRTSEGIAVAEQAMSIASAKGAAGLVAALQREVEDMRR